MSRMGRMVLAVVSAMLLVLSAAFAQAAEAAGESAPGGGALLLEAPDAGASQVSEFPGSITWSKGSDKGGLSTVVARVEVPARHLGAVLVIHRNVNAFLPASHLIDVTFAVAEGFPGGSVAELKGILTKDDKYAQGTPLVGATARIEGNTFLFGISAAPAVSVGNVERLKRDDWLDLAIIYATGKRAILTLGKDALAEALFREVLGVEPGAAGDVVPTPGQPADSITSVPRTVAPERADRIVTLTAPAQLKEALLADDIAEPAVDAILRALPGGHRFAALPAGARIRLLQGPAATAGGLVAYRVSIYIDDIHRLTAVRTEAGAYALGTEPARLDFVTGLPADAADAWPASALDKQARMRPVTLVR